MLCNKSWRDFLNTDGSMPHNPRIADVFYRRGLMETWGRGIELIMDGCKAAGLPKPTFEVNPPFVNLIIRFKESLGGLNGAITQKNGTITRKDGMINGMIKISEEDQSVLDVIAANPQYNREQIGNAIGKSPRMTARYIASLRKKGLIDKLGSNKSGRWVILIPDK